MVKRIFGLLLVLAGALLIADRSNIYPISNVIDILWPSALILIGVFSMIEQRRLNIFHLIITSIGVIFLLIHLDILESNQIVPMIIPGIIILIGISLIFSPRYHRHVVISSRGNYTAVFGGLEEKCVDKEFTTCEITAVFGEAKVDLSEIELKNERGVINVSAIFGGVELILPTKYHILIQGAPVLGGFENRLKHQNPQEKSLVIQYTSFLGGVEIKD